MPASIIALLILLMPILSSYHNRNSWDNQSYNVIYENQKEFINAVPNNEKCIIINDHTSYIFSYLIDKRGYIFWDDYLPIEWVKDMIINNKAKYMYSNSRKIENDIKEYIKDTIYSKGNVNVLELEVK